MLPATNQKRIDTTKPRCADKMNANMKVVLSNWRESNSLVKRQRDNKDDHTEQAANKRVRIISPNKQKTWYLGKSDCVNDIVCRFLKKLDTLGDGGICWVISGASGIGKSWSINVFMVELLRLKKKKISILGGWGVHGCSITSMR